MILHGDCFRVLSTLTPGAADACFTSPPYYGLRNYGVPATEWPAMSYAPMHGLPEVHVPAMTCALGLEPTPEAFIGHLVAIFRDVRRILPDTGTLLVNIGDSYSGNAKGETRNNETSTLKQGEKLTALRTPARPAIGGSVPKKNLLGIPWRLAFALQADGWVLRQDIIWNKPNPMPESVKDRCTKAHEYLFLLSKTAKGYYWDGKSIAEPATHADRNPEFSGQKKLDARYGEAAPDVSQRPGHLARLMGRNPGNKTHKFTRAVEGGEERHRTAAGLVKHAEGRAQLARALELAEQHGLTEAHLNALRAVGLSNNPRRSVLNTGSGANAEDTQRLADEARAALGSYAQEFLAASSRNPRSVWTISTTPFKEAHFAVMALALAEKGVLAITPPGGTVLDPFAGSGTTGRAAYRHGREFLGIELHPENVTLAERQLRRTQPGLGLVSA